MNNYFITDTDKQNFLKNKGYGGNQLASDFYSGGFDAANQSGKSYVEDFWSNNPVGSENDAFFTGLGEAKQQGWDDWFASTRGNTDLNAFDFDFDGTLDNFNDSTSFFDAADAGDLFGTASVDDTINSYLENTPGRETFDDVTGNLNTTRPATQKDVDNGLATEVGEMIEELNIPSRADALTIGYVERFDDAYDELKLKEKINQENLDAVIQLNNELERKQLSGLNTQFQDITDSLRGDNLNAMRAGMSGTNNATNRLLVDANMRASRDRSALSKDIIDAADLREYQFGKTAQDALAKMRNDFAAVIGKTPEETDFIVQLAKEYVELMAQKGEIDVQNAEEWWQKQFEVLDLIANNPNPDTYISLLQSQVAGMIAQIGAEDKAFREIMDGKFENIDEIANAIKNLNSTDPEYIRIVDKLNALTQQMNATKSTVSGGVNPLTTDRPVVPTYDSEGAAALMSQLQTLGQQSGDQSFIDLVTDVVDVFDELGNIWPDDDETDTDGDGTPDSVDPDPNDPAIS
jgi:hypothetical protein